MNYLILATLGLVILGLVYIYKDDLIESFSCGSNVKKVELLGTNGSSGIMTLADTGEKMMVFIKINMGIPFGNDFEMYKSHYQVFLFDQTTGNYIDVGKLVYTNGHWFKLGVEVDKKHQFNKIKIFQVSDNDRELVLRQEF